MTERDWVLCFERWQSAGKFHIRRPRLYPEEVPSFFCGMHTAREGAIRFEDELTESQMCKTCRKRALAQVEAELSAPPSSGGK